MGRRERESARLEFVDVSPLADETFDEVDFSSVPSVALLDYAPGASISARVPLAPLPEAPQQPVWSRRHRGSRRATEFYPTGDEGRRRGDAARASRAARDWSEQLARAGLPTCRLCGTHNRRDKLHCVRCGVRVGSRSSSTGTGSFPVQPTRSWRDAIGHLAVAAVVVGACGFLISLV